MHNSISVEVRQTVELKVAEPYPSGGKKTTLTRFHQVVPLLRNRNAPNKISVLSRCSTPRGCPGCQGCSGLSPGLSPGTPADMRYAGSSSDTIGFSPFKYLLILLGFSFGILFWDSLLGFLIRSLQQMLGYFSSTFLEFLRFLRGYFWPSSEPFIVFARILGIPFPRILAFLSSLILYKKIIGANSIPKILPNLWDTRQITVRRYLENKKYSRFLTNPRPGNS